MSLTPLQERRLKQTEDQVIFFEKQIREKGVWYAARFAFVLVIGFYIVGFLFDYFIEKKPLQQYVNEFEWGKLLFSFLFWFGVNYFFEVRSNHQQLKKTKRELEQLKKKYGLVEEPVS